MENFGISLNKVKQPKPDIVENNGQKRVIPHPYIGIIKDINPTSTPISDTISIREQENPRSRFKLNLNKNSPLNFNNIATGGVIACGLLAILSLFAIRKK